MNSPIKIPRHLTSSSANEAWEYDAVVVGSGVAGLMAAMKLAPHLKVALITKERLVDSNSFYAQGGMAVTIGENDSKALWKKDTIEAGAGLCRESAVDQVANYSEQIVADLESMGVPFDVDSDGKLMLGREAFHSVRRILHAGGDQTGRHLSKAMCDKLANSTSVIVFEESFAVDILTSASGAVAGLTAVVDDRDIIFKTPNIILSTGGCGQAYSHTSNPRVATGDGVAMALRAGASLVDMEFVQFHPTVCYANPTKPFLVTEAIRGEGAKLLNDLRERFMLKYSEHAELAPRDIVARACYTEMRNSGKDWVLLDTTIFDKEFLKTHFPTVYSQCLLAGFDPSEQPIPVAPGAHYLIGGVETDLYSRTSLKGLYVAGEVGSTGMHGANRLASNSLPEGMVTGLVAAKTVLSDANPQLEFQAPIDPGHSKEKMTRSALRVGNWQSVGVFREPELMQKHLVTLTKDSHKTSRIDSLGAIEHANLEIVSLAITMSAIARKESRGAHFRSDFPEQDNSQGSIRYHIKPKPFGNLTEITIGSHDKERYSWT